MEEIIKRFRVDTLKLSTEDMPEAETDGTTCYEVDTMKFYIYYKGQWYLQEAQEENSNEESEDENTPQEDVTESREKIEIKEETEPTEDVTESREKIEIKEETEPTEDVTESRENDQR